MKDLQPIINKLINKSVVGCDTYTNKNSLWLIFTDKKEWVIELTKTDTLWYNYYFFQKIFKVLGLDVIENQHYITKWVENTIQNGVRDTKGTASRFHFHVEDTIQNGVRDTESLRDLFYHIVENTIQNGVRNTHFNGGPFECIVEDTIQNGVKETNHFGFTLINKVTDIIQNGIKHNQII